jgi:hypothetical protein
VPDAAIGTEQARKYVLVVDGDNKVQQKYVTLGRCRATARDQGWPRGRRPGRGQRPHACTPRQTVKPQEQGGSPSAEAVGPQVRK